MKNTNNLTPHWGAVSLAQEKLPRVKTQRAVFLLCLALCFSVVSALFLALPQATPAHAAPASSCYTFGPGPYPATNGPVLHPCDEFEWETNNLNYLFLVYQTDGNFVLYCSAVTNALWANGKNDGHPYYVEFQPDGNLVDYHYFFGKYAAWASGTNGHSSAWLYLQGDGNVVIYKTHDNSPSNALWSTHTNGKC